MALANRIQVTTSTTGTGALTLASTGVRSASNGDCLAPAEVSAELGNRAVPYFITSGNNFAYGMGTLDAAATTLTRDVNERSWNGTAYSLGKLSLAGTSIVTITARAIDLGSGSRGRTIALARNILTL
jgi:hypothetical protein